MGVAFAGAANTGTEIGAADARAAINAFMIRLHIWTVVVFGIGASAGWRLQAQDADDCAAGP
jgi:hypothetical protein